MKYLQYFLAALVFVGNMIPVPPQTYYVSTSGSDSNSGSISAPFKTLAKAASVSVPGDTVSVQPGTYQERLTVSRSGIIFQGQPGVTTQGFIITGPNTTIDGFTIDNTPASGWNGYGIRIDSTGAVIKNTFVTRGPIGGIFVGPNGSGAQILNNKLFHNLRYGISVVGPGNLIQGNEIWDSVQFADWPQGQNPPSGFVPDADGMAFFNANQVIRGNNIHDIPSSNPDGTATNSHTDCFQSWGQVPASNTLIEGNICRNIQLQSVNTENLGAAFTLENNSGPITVRNNLIFADVCFFVHDTHDVSFLNNDCIVDQVIPGAPYPSGYPIGVTLGKNNLRTIIQNNLFYNVRGVKFFQAGTSSGTVHQNDYIAQASDFTNGWHLTASHPGSCVVTLDFDGVTRTICDIGAYEFVGVPVTFTNTPTLNTSTATYTQTSTVTSSPTVTASVTSSKTATPTLTPSATPSNTATATSTATATATRTPSMTPTRTPTVTPSPECLSFPAHNNQVVCLQ